MFVRCIRSYTLYINKYSAHWYVHCRSECSSDVHEATLSTEINTVHTGTYTVVVNVRPMYTQLHSLQKFIPICKDDVWTQIIFIDRFLYILLYILYIIPHCIRIYCNLLSNVYLENFIYIYIYIYIYIFHGATAPSGARPPHYRGFTITLKHTTLGRTPLDEWSARHSDLNLTTHNTHKRQTSMPPAGFESAISASERPQTHTLDRAAAQI